MIPVLLLIFGIGAVIAGLGFYLAREYRAAATYDGIGGFDGSPAGCLGVLGGLLVIVGLSGMIVSGLLVYTELFR